MVKGGFRTWRRKSAWTPILFLWGGVGRFEDSGAQGRTLKDRQDGLYV